MTKKIVVLGGGTGGTMVANHLAKELKTKIKQNEVSITMISNQDKHIYQPGYLFIAFGQEKQEHYVRSQRSLLLPQINLVIDKAEKIDKTRKVVKTVNGEYNYDYLVIATGSVPRFDLVPGLTEGSDNLYTLEGSLKLREKLTNFKGGKIVLSVGVPHKCPVAPIEVTLMMHEFFKTKGILDQVEIVYTYPIDNIHVAPSVAKWLKPELEKRGIRYISQFDAKEVDANKKVITAKNGQQENYDLLISIPAHRGQEVILNSDGLANQQGWIPVNQYTLKAENDDYIYVVGDATALSISKAGSTAHYESEYVAKNLAAEIEGLTPSKFFNGKVFCFIETGLEEATYITMDYENPPKPIPPNGMLYWFKTTFNEMYWLAAKGVL